ncbi:hypothetical protein HYPSUDRAFT_216253 [Hypholoma sublateritium FD-334 SS-4]|uniref:Heterokaryon incompatibility domain-containing protein n=1 Tax=Hypholoma sublateritium (strain FD-334 SS-4) TaxID=945553 RepID=A0A0D2NRU1_HYPSF|nr:hypothetical protein HYPSUDRAFT_216253 [Hypholoma sublateritium FD-334 SS-4]
MSKHQVNGNNPAVSIPTSNAHGLALLAGLVGFIRPYINMYATAAGVSHALQDCVDFDSRAERLCSGTQGHELLSALGKFFQELAAPNGDIADNGGGKLVAPDKAVPDQEPIPVEQHVSIAKPITTEYLSQTIVNQVHQHIFNKMPIRMLAIGSNGPQLRLLERSEIVEEIKSRISRKRWQGLREYESLALVEELARYAILSHTWLRGKPGDVVYGNWKERELNPEGNSKIVEFCMAAARNHGVVYGWMDTVCIDKSSSAELDESIRSMYWWYRQSHVCITYLGDTAAIPDMHRDAWFTRGWTLQELLAPRNMVFYSKDWTLLSQNDEPMEVYPDIKTFPKATQSQIFQATTIESEELEMCSMELGLLPISRVFQLACRRTVTREEDRVYSLMGLLGTSIPAAYGEGLPAAFKRLVREIMVTKTIFLDVFNHSDLDRLIPRSISKYENRSPLFDQTSSRWSTELHIMQSIEPISMTHLGVHIPILLVPLFQKIVYDARIPLGACPNSINIPAPPEWYYSNDGPAEYLLLNNNLISADFIANFYRAGKRYGMDKKYKVIFCGILNFWKSDSGYQTSNRWLYVSFAFGSRYAPNLATGVDARDLIQSSGPLVLSLPSEHSPGYENMQEQDLRRMGMKFTTLHLQ